VAQVAAKDWSAALANMQAATLRADCRPEIASFSEASEEVSWNRRTVIGTMKARIAEG